MQQCEFTVLHLFSGIGGAALGFQQAVEEYRGLVGRFRTLVGIDVDPEACEDFQMLTGAPAVQMDLFSRQDYVAYHGHEPPADWREATPGDIRAATGGRYPDCVFLSPPCKGFSALLPAARASTDKYRALNNLVLRGLELVIGAFCDDLSAVIMMENVPRITTRGAFLLRRVKRLLREYGYVIDEGFHDCGQLGGLGQHRRRYLLIARLPEKVPAFVYRPPKRRVKSIGEVLGPLPLPDDPSLGPMHRLPRLKWRTWLRLALIPAGGDWRDLERLAADWYRNAYRIIPWNEAAECVTSGGSPSCGGVSVADPGLGYCPRKGAFRVAHWDRPATTIIGAADVRGSNGVAAVADPRLPRREIRHPAVYQVVRWDEPGPCVTGSRFGSGAPAVADPRLLLNPNGHNNICRVTRWEQPANTVTGAARLASGATSVTDPRFNRPAKNGTMGVQAWNKPAFAVTAALDVHSGPGAVADPRIPSDEDRPDPPPVIVALDGTWHRPLTTLELAALQGFPAVLSDGRPLVLAGRSDARWRERIGNAVPPPAARAIAEAILRALLPSRIGVWVMGHTPIWVRPVDDVPSPPDIFAGGWVE